MSGEWSSRKPNSKFPACAQVARRLLAEVYGCKPGDKIPAEDVLLERAGEVLASRGNGSWDWAKAETALAMLDEIGGL